jgi:hypothetical protein
MSWGLSAAAIGQSLAFAALNQTGEEAPMEMVGWGLPVKAGEEQTQPRHSTTPVFPLEPVQPQML